MEECHLDLLQLGTYHLFSGGGGMGCFFQQLKTRYFFRQSESIYFL